MVTLREVRLCKWLPVLDHVGDHQDQVVGTFVDALVAVAGPLDDGVAGAVDMDAAGIAVRLMGELALLDRGDQLTVVAVFACA